MSYKISELANDELFANGYVNKGGLLCKSINLQIKNPLSFTKELKDNIKLLSVRPENTVIFGSFNYRVSLYPGDIDLMEDVSYKGTREHAAFLFAKAFTNTLKSIHKEKEHYVGETKAGIDERFVIYIGYWINGILYFYDDQEVLKKVEKLYKDGLLDLDKFKIMEELIKDINHDKWNLLYNTIRNLFTIRWSYEEVIKGYKILPGNVKKTLYEAFLDKIIMKFDIQLKINGKFIEMSNFFILQNVLENGEIKMVNLPQDYLKDIPLQLRYEVEKLYYNKEFTNYFKMAKRIFSIARMENKSNIARDMINLLNSDAGILYVVKSELDTISIMLGHIKNPPIKELINQLEQTKMRVSYITELDFDSVNYYEKVDYIVSNYHKLHYSTIIEKLKLLKKEMIYAINKYSFNYLKLNKYTPPPRSLLPPVLKYVY